MNRYGTRNLLKFFDYFNFLSETGSRQSAKSEMVRGNVGGLWKGENIKLVWEKRWQVFSIKDQTVNILDFECHTICHNYSTLLL